jgi:putative ATPase
MAAGTVVLVCATTENPSFELNAALLSRAQVLRFDPLGPEELALMAQRAEAALGHPLPLDDEARTTLYELADGDGRALLGLIEEVFAAARQGETLDKAGLLQVVQRRAPIYDKKQDGHYNLISALHKTVRGSDPDAALYYLARMLVAGEDPLFLARRMIRMASEDIGMADPQALPLAIAARDAYEMLGSPEGELALAELAVYLATAPKSNSVEVAFNEAMALARSSGSPMPPMTILNAPTKMMKGQGYGRGYIYDHDTPEGFSGQEYFPEKLGRQNFYRPVERGFEREIIKRLEYFSRLRAKKREEEASE